MKVIGFGNASVMNLSQSEIPPGSCSYFLRGCSGETDTTYVEDVCKKGGTGCKMKDILDEAVRNAKKRKYKVNNPQK